MAKKWQKDYLTTSLRIPKKISAELYKMAVELGMSRNNYIVNLLTFAVDVHNANSNKKQLDFELPTESEAFKTMMNGAINANVPKQIKKLFK